MISINTKLAKKEKRQIYDDMHKKLTDITEEYENYKKMTKMELEVNHKVIER